MSENPPANQDHGSTSRETHSVRESTPGYVVGGDHLAASFDECRAGLRSFLAGKLPQSADVEDCLQAVQMALLKNQTPLPRAATRAWLFRVAANEAALYWRRRSAAQRLTDQAAADLGNDSFDHNTPETASERSETRRRVIDAIETLPEESKQIVRMRIHDDLTFQQIADRLNQPLGTVLSRMRRAAIKLRQLLADEAPDAGKRDRRK